MQYLFGALIVVVGITLVIAGATNNALNLFSTVTGKTASPAQPAASATSTATTGTSSTVLYPFGSAGQIAATGTTPLAA